MAERDKHPDVTKMTLLLHSYIKGHKSVIIRLLYNYVSLARESMEFYSTMLSPNEDL